MKSTDISIWDPPQGPLLKYPPLGQPISNNKPTLFDMVLTMVLSPLISMIWAPDLGPLLKYPPPWSADFEQQTYPFRYGFDHGFVALDFQWFWRPAWGPS